MAAIQTLPGIDGPNGVRLVQSDPASRRLTGTSRRSTQVLRSSILNDQPRPASSHAHGDGGTTSLRRECLLWVGSWATFQLMPKSLTSRNHTRGAIGVYDGCTSCHCQSSSQLCEPCLPNCSPQRGCLTSTKRSREGKEVDCPAMPRASTKHD